MARKLRSGALVVLSGPSGVGKTTLAARLLELPRFRRVVTATTRTPRPGERDGVDYFFLSREEFLARVERGEFLEHATVFGHLYGTPRAPLDEWVEEGWRVLLCVDVQGAGQLRANGVEAMFFFITPPSMAELERRLRMRGSNSEGAIHHRLDVARTELEEASAYEHIVVNDDLDVTVARIVAILEERDRSVEQR